MSIMSSDSRNAGSRRGDVQCVALRAFVESSARCRQSRARRSGRQRRHGDQVGDDPLLTATGLTNNGGPTDAIALQSGSSDLGARLQSSANSHRPARAAQIGDGGTDIAAYQSGPVIDTQPPTALLEATFVDACNAGQRARGYARLLP